jgi:plasmid stabilization system protein ParE
VRHVYSPQALTDLKRLHDFIADKNPIAASRISKRLREGIGQLRQQPRMGRRVNQAPGQLAPEEIRDWVVGPYVVRYLILPEMVVILRIWHGREDR